MAGGESKKTLSIPGKSRKKKLGRFKSPKKAAKPWLLAISIIFGTYFGLVFAGVAIVGVSLGSAYAAVNDARQSANEFKFTEAYADIERSESFFNQSKIGLGLMSLLRPIPYVGAQVRGAQVVLAASSEGLQVLKGGLAIGEDILTSAEDLEETLIAQQNFSFYDLPLETRAKLLNTIARSTEDLQDMRARIRLADNELKELDDLAIAPQVRDLIDPIRETLPDIERSLDFLIPLTAVIRDVAGVGEDKQWLVLYLNNAELRPGGGFMGVYGLLLMRDGEIQSLDVEDVYVADALVAGTGYSSRPPEAIRRYLGVDTWYFRDANWSPDFAVSSEFAEQLLRQQYNYAGRPVPEIDGVIGITPDIAERIMAFLGPVEVDGFTFTADNVYDLIQFETQFGFKDRGLDVNQRKEIISKLTDEVIGKLLALPLSEIPTVLNIVLDSFEDKQIALYSNTESSQQVIAGSGWGGIVEVDPDSDQLLFVDANMAALKTDPVVNRSISYEVQEVAGRLRARAEITYNHSGTFTGLTTRYRTYARLFVPAGSELIRVEGSLADDLLNNPSGNPGDVVIESDLGMTSFGTFTAIEPGRQGVLAFEYYLPARIQDSLDEGRYDLQVIKQMGAANYPLTVKIESDKNISSAAPAEARGNRGDSAYFIETTLNKDLDFKVRY